jgi:flagellar hook-length control protein FliK
MNTVALLALLDALPAASGKVGVHAASTSSASEWRAALGGRGTASTKAVSTTVAVDPLTEAVTRAVASGTSLTSIAETAAAALGTAIAASADQSADPEPVIAAVKAALDPPDPGGTGSETLDQRVRALVARLRKVADAAARVSETTTGQQNRFPGNDLDAATAAKANPAPTTTGTSDAAASETLADRLLTVVRTAISGGTKHAAGAAPAYLAVHPHMAAVSASAALLGTYVDAVARAAPNAASAAGANVVVSLPLPTGNVAVRASVTVDETGAHAVLTVADTATRDAVAARRTAVVAELRRSGIAVADVAITVDPALAAPTSAPAAIAPAPAALRLAVANAAAAHADPSAATPQVLTAVAYRAPAVAAPAPPVSLAGARALPVVVSVAVPAAAASGEGAVPVAPAPAVSASPVGAAPTPAEALAAATAAAADAPASSDSGFVPAALLSTAPAPAPIATALAPTVLDVATLAATSAPAAIAPPRDAATLVLTQAIAQAAARLDAGMPLAQPATTGDQAAERDAREQSDAGTAQGLPQAPTTPLAAAPASASPAPAAPADPYAIMEQLASAVVRTASGHAQTATELRVRLSPENLGELSVAVRVDGASVTAQVTTHDAATHAVLASSGDGLAKTLAAAGLRLDGFTVSLAGGAPQDFGRGSAQPQGERGRGRRASFGTEADDVDPTAVVEPGVPIVQRPGTLDELV